MKKTRGVGEGVYFITSRCDFAGRKN